MSYLSLSSSSILRRIAIFPRLTNLRYASTTKSTEDEEIADVVIKEIPDALVHWEYGQDSATAKIYDRKPIKIKCREGKMYMW